MQFKFTWIEFQIGKSPKKETAAVNLLNFLTLFAPVSNVRSLVRLIIRFAAEHKQGQECGASDTGKLLQVNDLRHIARRVCQIIRAIPTNGKG